MSKKLSPEDEQLWREVTKDMAGKQKPAASKMQDTIDFTEAVKTPALPSPTKYKAPYSPKAATMPLAPLDKRSAARHFKTHPAIQASLDLHGMTQAQAHTALNQFVEQQIANGSRRIEIITGKGRTGEGVLRRKVPEWLNELWRAHISAIAPAPKNKGGEGALHVLLKSTYRKQDHER